MFITFGNINEVQVFSTLYGALTENTSSDKQTKTV